MAGKEAPPYFDVIFSRLEEEDPDTRLAFGRHVHWGFWADPDQADGSAADYATAAEGLCRRVCDAAGIRDGQRVLDVGCGFGGTIASLNERFHNLDLVGVNIDGRQLERARAKVKPRNGNQVRFVEADACQMPLPANSFDVVLAVECIFHFDSRARFLAEAGRVLVEGGRMALSDFVPTEKSLPLLQHFKATADPAVQQTYGKVDFMCPVTSYRQIAAAGGLEVDREDDINVHTLPTYNFLRQNLRSWKDPDEAAVFDKATAQIEMVCRAHLLHYTVLSFQKPTRGARKQSA